MSPLRVGQEHARSWHQGTPGERIIDSRLAEWAAELQKARNLSAHASGEKTLREDAEDLLQFVSAICEYIFVLTRRFQRFMKRKQESPGKKPTLKRRLSPSDDSALMAA